MSKKNKPVQTTPDTLKKVMSWYDSLSKEAQVALVQGTIEDVLSSIAKVVVR